MVTRRQHTAAITSVIYSPSGGRLYTAGEDGLLTLAEPVNDYIASRIIDFAATGPVAMALGSTGTRLAFAGPHRSYITLFAVADMQEICRIPLTPITPKLMLAEAVETVSNLCFAPDGSQLYVTTGDGRLMCIDLQIACPTREVGAITPLCCSISKISSPLGTRCPRRCYTWTMFGHG